MNLNGWKSIVGYILAEGMSILSTGNPLVQAAVEKAVAEPSLANICMAVGQVMLAIGLLHKGIKNVGAK